MVCWLQRGGVWKWRCCEGCSVNVMKLVKHWNYEARQCVMVVAICYA